MKKYMALFRIRFINSLQYRTAALAGLCTQFAWGFMEISVFSAFYNTNPHAFPMEFSQVASYIWLQQALLFIFFILLNDNDIVASIIDGSIAYELVRPMNLYNRWACQITASRLAGVLLRAFPVLIVASLLPYPYGLSLPPDALQFLWFLISAILGVILTVVFTVFCYTLLFHTLSIQGIRIMIFGFVSFLSGQVVPLPFFPEPLLSMVLLLPFASMQDLPLRIYSGHIAGQEVFYRIGVQFLWVLIMLVAGRLIIRSALKKVVIQGG